MQDTKNGTFVRLEGLRLRAHGDEVLLAAAAYIGANAVLLILLVHPNRGHCSRRRALPCCPNERIGAILYLGYQRDLSRRGRHTRVHKPGGKKNAPPINNARAPVPLSLRAATKNVSRSLTVGCASQSRGKTDGRSPRRSEWFGCRLISNKRKTSTAGGTLWGALRETGQWRAWETRRPIATSVFARS